MKLKIQRDQKQKKGLLGGNKGIEFTLNCKVELTPEEQALIDKAKVGNYTLISYVPQGWEHELTFNVNDIVDGIVFQEMSVGKLLDLEEQVKNGCQNLKSLLEVIASFGGEEIIEF